MSLSEIRLAEDIVARINARAGRVVITDDKFIKDLSAAIVAEIKQANVSFTNVSTVMSPSGHCSGVLNNGVII